MQLLPRIFYSILMAGLVQGVSTELCDVTVYHPVCGYRGYMRTFFSDCLMQLENYGLVDDPGFVKVQDGPCPSHKIDINEY